MIKILSLIIFSFMAAHCSAELENPHPAWSIDFPGPVAVLDGVQTLISFQDKLFLFNIKKKTGYLRPGLYHNGNLEILPNFKSYGQISAHTLWNDDLVVAGKLPFSGLPQIDGSRTINRLFLFNGHSWSELDSDFQGRVSAMVQWNGDLIVAGRLSIKNKPELTCLARWDGKSWHEVKGQPKGGGEPRISCMTVHESRLVVGGIFAELGGTKVRNLAVFDGTNWDAVGGGPNGLIGNITSFQGDVFVNGKFSCIGGKSIKGLARWDGQQWHSLSSDNTLTKQASRFWDIKLVPTPNGLYMSGNMERYTGIDNQSIACWNEQAWVSSLPTLHRTKEFVYRKLSEQPQKPILSLPLSEPSVQCLDIDSHVIRSFVQDMTWHKGELVLYSRGDSGCGTSDRNPRLLTHDGSSWRSLLEESLPEAKFLGSYRQGTLHLLGDQSNGWELVWRKNYDQESLAHWVPGASVFGPPAIQVQGDTIIVVGNFNNLEGLKCQHAALYDGHKWGAMGDGIPFDRVRDVKLYKTSGGLYATAQFYNIGFRENAGLMEWTGRQWEIIELDTGRYWGSPIMSDGKWLYRAETEQTPSKGLWSPSHEWLTFPADSRPSIQRWNGTSWELVWQGKTGKISQFLVFDETLWAILSKGRDETLLKLENDHWVTVAGGPFAGLKTTDINSIRQLVVYQGKPVIMLPDYNSSSELLRLAVLNEGNWFWFGPEFRKLGYLRVVGNQLQLTARFIIDPPYKNRMGTLNWEGSFTFDEPVPMLDLAMLDQWEAICRASDQNDRPELDLPWPKGLKKFRDGKDIAAFQRAGWHLSSWPDSVNLADAIQTKGKNTIVFKPGTKEDLQFFFWWSKEQPGLFEYEYRLIGPENWEWAGRTASESQLGTPLLNDEISSALPSVRVDVNNLSKRVFLWAEDDQWHKVSIPFGKSSQPGVRRLVFKGGETLTGKGRIEIKNLRIRKKKREDYQDLVKEIIEILDEYSCSKTARERLDAYCSKLKASSRGKDDAKTRALMGAFFSSRGLMGGLLREDEIGEHDLKRVHEEFKLVVENFTVGVINAGWVPGGGLYVATDPIPTFLRQGGYFHKLHADSSSINSIKGLIFDMRRGQSHFRDHAEKEFDRANRAWSLFAGEPQYWGQMLTGMPGSSRIDLTVQPSEYSWNKVPVVALVSEKTPGYVVMLLNSLPNMTTVGRPSAPVPVPTHAHLLSNGQWGEFPIGRVYDRKGKDVSLCRIAPDIEVPLNASWDTAIREGMQALGLNPDPESSFCPVEFPSSQ